MDIICTDPSCDCRAALAYRALAPAAPTGPAWCDSTECKFAGRPHLYRDHFAILLSPPIEGPICGSEITGASGATWVCGLDRGHPRQHNVHGRSW